MSHLCRQPARNSHPRGFRRILSLLPALAALLASVLPAAAHNLDTRATTIYFADDFRNVMATRATNQPGQPLVRVGDEFWVVLKTTPGPGTPTGVGGYQTFYVPEGLRVKDVAYVRQDSSDPRGFVPIPMKGQSPIAVGAGPIGPSSTPELIGWSLPGTNGLGTNFAPVTATGVDRGTIAGVYADTGVFFSTDPRTVVNSYGITPANTNPAPMKNNSGDTVGEYWAANVVNAQQQGVNGWMTLWDSYQLRAFGSADVAPIIDTGSGRGNTPWGMGSAVAGPQSGYAWEFDLPTYNSTPGTHTQKMRAAIGIGPWERIQYPGSQIAFDTPGNLSSVIGNVGIDASNLGIPASSIPASGVNAVRFAIGQLELGRPEYSAVKVEVVSPVAGACSDFEMYSDAFGGDAGGTSTGKDHIWRYFDPTLQTLAACTLLQKTASKALVAPGETFFYTITFANNGATPLPDVKIVDTLPTGVVHVSAIPSPSVSASPNFTWNIGTMAPYSIVTITQYVRATGTGTLFNTATATSLGNIVGVSQASVEVGTRSLLEKDKSVTPSNAAPGATVTYTLNVRNVGTGTTGVPVLVRDYLPAGFTYANFVSATLNGAAIAPPALAINSSVPSTPTFTISQGIQPGQALVIRFTALVGAGVQPGTYYNQFEVDYEGKRVPPVPEAPVTVGGGQIGDFVWRDWDGDGVQDAGEEGLPGVTVGLYASDGTTLLATKVTDANGNYLFTGLNAGTYVVKVNSGVPAGYTLTEPTPTAQKTITIAASQINLTADFGYRPGGTGSIGDQVFEDVNKNGVWNAGEPGIPNVTVNLYEDTNGNGVIDSGDLLIAAQATNGSGNYSFTSLDTIRSYLVEVNTTDADIGTYFTGLYGAPANQLTSTNPFPVASGFTTVTSADFGFWRSVPATIGDQVFIDANQNGVYDAGDSPLPSVTVNLYAADGVTLIQTTSTAVDGTYSFTGLPAATYVVKVDTVDPDLPGTLTASVAQYSGVVMAAGATDLTRDFPFLAVFSKTADKTFANTNELITYTMAPYWPGPGLLTNVTVSDAIPVGTRYVPSSASPAATVTAGNNTNATNVTWNLGTNTPGVPGILTNAVSTNTNTVNLGAAADSWLNANATATNYGSSNSMRLDGSGGGSGNGRPIIRFDVSSIPTNATITAASMRLTAVAVEANDARIIRAYPLTQSFVESQVTWNVRATGTNWTTAGGSFGTEITNTSVTNTGAYTWSGSNMVTTVRSWVTNSATNFGLLLADTATGGVDKDFATKENATTNNRPVLEVTYTSVSTNTPSTNSISVSPKLVTATTNGVNVTVSMAVSAGSAVTNVTAPASLTVINGANGASATYVSGPTGSPVTFGAGGGTATFTWVYKVTPGTAPNEVKFSGTPTGTGGTFASATSDGILVTPPLTMQVRVNTPPGVPVINNTANFFNGPTLLASGSAQTQTSGSIGDFVWADVDGDGVQDSGETGIPGVRVYLDSNDNGQYDPGEPNALTDSAGAYRISGLSAGTYTIRYDLSTVPSGYVATTPSSIVHTLAQGEQYNNGDFGLRTLPPGTGSVGDFVWLDSDGDGVQDAGEAGLPGISLTLERFINGNWSAVGTTTTDANGAYSFTGLSAADYRVVVDTNSQVTSPYTAGTFNLGSAMAPTADRDGIGTANVATFTLATNSTVLTDVDFGYNWSGTIGDKVWWDYNTNGLQDEVPLVGIPNARVQLYFDANNDGLLSALDGDVEIRRVFTDANGNYLLSNLPPGNYLVDVYEDSLVEANGVRNVVPTTADVIPINLGAGQTVLTADFGYFEGARVEAKIFHDVNANTFQESGETLLDGIEVTLTGTDNFGNPVTRTATTDGNGNVVFLVPEGNYTITYDTAEAATLFPALTEETTVTSFQFAAQAGEDGIQIFEFGLDDTGRIGDTIFADVDGDGSQDPGEPGLPGVTINLWYDANGDGDYDDAGDELVAVTSTDAFGKYAFTGLGDTSGNARYLVEVVTSSLPSGYETEPTAYPAGATPANSRYLTALTGGQTIDIVDFGYPPEAGTYYSVSGNIYNDNGAGGGTASDGVLNGTEPGLGTVTVTVEVDADNDTVFETTYTIVTDGTGNYSASGIPEGADVRITVNNGTLPSPAFVQTGDPDNNTATSNIWNITNIQADATNLNFGYLENLGSIAGTVVRGENGNGLADGTEPPIEGVTVTRRYAGADGILGTDDDVVTTTTTAADGTYAFTGLQPGLYEITTEIPGAYIALADRDGGNPNSINVTLGLGQDVTTRDFEYQALACANTWTSWQDAFNLTNETPAGNDDGDLYSNLVEYAFCMNPNNGTGSAWCPDYNVESRYGKVDAVFARTAGGGKDVIYQLQHAATLTTNTAWTTTNLNFATLQVTPNYETGREVVRIVDVAAFTGRTNGTGFIRLRAVLDSNGNGTADEGEPAAITDAGGWIATPMPTNTAHIRTFNDPFLSCPVFTGTINSVDGQDLVLTTSANGLDMATLFKPEESYYAEVTDGPNEGQRFDVAPARGTTNRLTMATDSNPYSADEPYSTKVDVPTNLAGAPIIVRRHRTMGEVIQAGALNATGDATTASNLQILAGGNWKTYWLYANNGDPAWVEMGDMDLVDQGDRPYTPGQGAFLRPRMTSGQLMLFGKVRENDFIRPVAQGLNLVGGGYPLVQSAAGRTMSATANGYYPNRDFKVADAFSLWRGDSQPGVHVYDNYFYANRLVDTPSYYRWARSGDAAVAVRDNEPLFKPDYSVILRLNNNLPNNRMPSPWNNQ